jgi:hypothetical protein
VSQSAVDLSAVSSLGQHTGWKGFTLLRRRGPDWVFHATVSITTINTISTACHGDQRRFPLHKSDAGGFSGFHDVDRRHYDGTLVFPATASIPTTRMPYLPAIPWRAGNTGYALSPRSAIMNEGKGGRGGVDGRMYIRSRLKKTLRRAR